MGVFNQVTMVLFIFCVFLNRCLLIPLSTLNSFFGKIHQLRRLQVTHSDFRSSRRVYNSSTFSALSKLNTIIISVGNPFHPAPLNIADIPQYAMFKSIVFLSINFDFHHRCAVKNVTGLPLHYETNPKANYLYLI